MVLYIDSPLVVGLDPGSQLFVWLPSTKLQAQGGVLGLQKRQKRFRAQQRRRQNRKDSIGVVGRPHEPERASCSLALIKRQADKFLKPWP